MYIVRSYNPAYFRDINQIYVRNIYTGDNRCYEEYYKKTYTIEIIHGYITCKEIGEVILRQNKTTMYKIRPLLRR